MHRPSFDASADDSQTDAIDQEQEIHRDKPSLAESRNGITEPERRVAHAEQQQRWDGKLAIEKSLDRETIELWVVRRARQHQRDQEGQGQVALSVRLSMSQRPHLFSKLKSARQLVLHDETSTQVVVVVVE